jgi:ribosome-associated protein
MEAAALPVGRFLRIPLAELSFRATRAGGPGGQHVNKSATRVELWWNLEQSAAPSPEQRAVLRERLGRRVDREGWVRLVEAGSRSQLRNREAVTERLVALLSRALTPRTPRQRTTVPARERRRRLEEKRRRAGTKRLREKPRSDE